jgi:hypothetical protein
LYDASTLVNLCENRSSFTTASGEAVGAAHPDVGGLGAHWSTRTGRPTPRDPGYRGRGLVRLASVESELVTAIGRLH